MEKFVGSNTSCYVGCSSAGTHSINASLQKLSSFNLDTLPYEFTHLCQQ